MKDYCLGIEHPSVKDSFSFGEKLLNYHPIKEETKLCIKHVGNADKMVEYFVML
jgi:hypothetical protein